MNARKRTRLTQRPKFGLVIPTFLGGVRGSEAPSVETLVEFSQRVEELKFESAWVIDHLLVGEPIYRCTWYEPLSVLTAMATVTKRVKLGTSVLVLPIRNPAILAKQIATMDHLSKGRIILGVGNGWWDKEFEACGVPKSERGPRVSETIQILRKLWTGEPTDHSGKFFHFKGISMEPKPFQKPCPPIWIAGGTAVGKAEGVYSVKAEQVLKRIARLGDGWIARAVTTANKISDDYKRIKEYARQYGRDPEKIVFAHLNFVHITDEHDAHMESARQAFSKISNLPFEDIKREYIVGPKQVVTQRIDELMKLGIQHLIVWPTGPDYKTIEFLADEIMPRYK